MPSSQYPAGALLLHTPWCFLNGNYVGMLTDPNVAHCNPFSELRKQTPKIVDCFLNLTSRDRVFSDTIFDDPKGHFHETKHEHSEYVPSSSDTTDVGGEDIIGGFVSVSSPAHRHHLHLAESGNTVYTAKRPDPDPDSIEYNYEDPLHVEVAAHYVNSDTAIPAGAIVLFSEQVTDAVRLAIKKAGWTIMNETELPYGDNDPDADTHPWADCYLKVVGCIPRRKRQGNADHTHNGAAHKHWDGTVDESSLSTKCDKDSGTVSPRTVPKVKHTHDVDVGYSYDQVSREPNEPESVGLYTLVATSENAEFLRGMLIPFIPRKLEDFYPPPKGFSQWVFPDEFEGHFLYSLRSAPERMERHGSRTHKHQFPHDHTVTLKPGVATKRDADAEKDFHAAGPSHEHSHVMRFGAAGDEIWTSEGEHVLKHRKVKFMEYRL